MSEQQPEAKPTTHDWLQQAREQHERQREHLLDTLLRRQPKPDDQPAGT